MARADVRTITFDDQPVGAITSQYHAQGVDFGHRPDGGQDGNSTIVSVPGTAHSGTQALFVGCGGEICPANTWAGFTAPRSTVSAYVGSNNIGSPTVTMEAYDLSNNLLTSTTATVGASESTLMTVTRSQGDIWFVRVTGGGSTYVYLDDLSFDVPATPPAPDFGLATGDTSGIALTDGISSTTDLIVRRVTGSAGLISLGVSGLPAGVTASLAPNPTTGGDGSAVVLKLTAATDAPPVSRALVTVTGTPADPAVGLQPRSVTIPVSVGGSFTGFDVRIKGIEVTQGIQSAGFLIPSGAFGNQGSYRGVDLAAFGKTIVRVYADAVGGPSSGIPAGMTLSGADAAGRDLPGGPLLPIGTPPPLVAKPFDGVGPAERLDPNGAYSFVLPPAWTRGRISLHADLLPLPEPVFRGDPRYSECSRPACLANNHYGINDVDFHPVRPYTLDVLELKTKNDVDPLGPLQQVFSAPIAWLPLGEGQLILRGPVAVLRNHDNDLNQQVENWWNDNGHPGDAAMGVGSGRGGGQTWTHTAIASAARPFTALSHEFGHLLGRQHASADCGGADPSKPRTFEDWPPDQHGYLQGVAVDRREQYGNSAPFRIIAAGVPNADSQAFDFMSYCAGEGNSWLSPRGWQQIITSLEVTGSRRSRAATSDATRTLPREGRGSAAASSRLQVTVLVTGNATTVSDVRPLAGAPPPGGVASSYRLRAVGSGGRVLAEAPLTGRQVHVNHGGQRQELSGSLLASLASVSAVQVTRDGTVVAARARTPHVPTVQVLTPRRGAQVRGRGTVRVTWRARDLDAGALEIRVDYSIDDGRTWRQIAADANTGATRIPAALFARSPRARIRVVASDGFNQGTAVSRRFQAAGHPPVVRIDSPSPHTSVPAGATLLLAGAAFDDRFASIRPRELRWYDGHRLLGRGQELAITGELAPGRRHLRLVARDRTGRTSAASLVVRVRAVAPQFLQILAPRRVSARATRLTLRIRCSLPATLEALGRRVSVSRHTSSVTFHIHPGNAPLRVRLRLRAFGKSTVLSLTVPRRR